MKHASNSFLGAIRSGKPQVGLWLSLSTAFSSEVVASAGYDWVLIDMEHSPNDLSSVMGQLQVFEAWDTTPIVRPEWNDSVLVKRLLDTGAPGLLFPMVQTPDESQSAVQATRYPPRGIRGVSGTTRANRFGRVTDYFDRIEDETAVLVQVETRSAVEQAESIGGIDGVSGVFFGPADIAADLGHLGQPMHPEVWDLIMPVAKKLISQGVPVGTLVFDTDFAKRLYGEGFTFIAVGSDAGLLARGADSLLNTMRS